MNLPDTVFFFSQPYFSVCFLDLKNVEDTSDVLIPSVFIAQHHYRELRYLGMELGKEYLVKMTPDDMQWYKKCRLLFAPIKPTPGFSSLSLTS